MTGDFKDHFSDQSAGYAKYRPTYPNELFQFLSSVSSGHSLVWDCATGNGQAAVALADYFSNVIASDASRSQIDSAVVHPKVEYRVATADQSGLADNSVDLITVGQAFHWFDEKLFMAEAQRVLRPAGVLAIWAYQLGQVSPECDAIINILYEDIVGEYWLPERMMVDQGYSHLVMPGAPVVAPGFTMSVQWRAADMLGYLRTWSASKRYKAAQGTDPVAQIESELIGAWGDSERTVIWPLTIKVSQPNTLLE